MQLDVLMQKHHWFSSWLVLLAKLVRAARPVFCRTPKSYLNMGMNLDYSFIRVKVDIVAGQIDDVLRIVFFGLLNSV